MAIPLIKDKENNEYSSFVPYAQGGMGEIYKGICISTNEAVILKLIKKLAGVDSEKQKREVDISKKLNHKNVVETIDTGDIILDGVEYYYILMKYYQRGALKVEESSKLPLQECYKWMMDILDGMEAIHEIAVHRDLKPENILIDDCNNLRITDFGIAKYVEDDTKTNTFKGSGTLPYMAPECWRYLENTPKMDIYALGIIFYQMLTAKYPYAIKPVMSNLDWRNACLFEPISSILTQRKDVPVLLDQMIQKMTNKRTEKRYNNIEEIKQVLNQVISSTESNNSQFVDTIVSMANHAIREKTESELKEEQAKEKEREYVSLLHYHILELTNEIKEAVELVNSQLEVNKIKIIENEKPDSTNYHLSIGFMNNSVEIEFWDYKLIKKYEDEQKEINKRNQMRMYGIPFQILPYNPSFLVKDSIALIGAVSTNFRNGLFQESFNLLLEKPENVDYGTWKTFQVSKNITPREPSFGIDKRDFLRIYEQYQASPLHTCKTEPYKSQRIMQLITLMVQLG